MWELHTQRAGGIVGDEMGLGKTVQARARRCAWLGPHRIRRAPDLNCLSDCACAFTHHTNPISTRS